MLAMPELPEVESIRRILTGRIVGRSIAGVTLRRRDVVRGPAEPAALLARARILDVTRRGKQLALVGERPDGTTPCLCVHLGMTGQLRWHGWAEDGHSEVHPEEGDGKGPHVHAVWHFVGGGQLAFQDARRFGGLWPFADVGRLHAQRWDRLGCDALTVRPRALHHRLGRTRRGLKAALLDQNLVAGLGNIYVDELLFAAGLNPWQTAATLTLPQVQRLVRQMRRLLNRAIAAGGSTFRDYLDSEGAAGGYQRWHRVYGRAGEPCCGCRLPLSSALAAGRTTVYCQACQRWGADRWVRDG